MIKIKEDNLDVRFLNHGLVYVTFYEGSHLSRHLIREINVISKVNFGSTPVGYIFNVDDDCTSPLFKEVYEKTDRLDNRPVAVIVKKSAARTAEINHQYNGPARVFKSFKGALSWLKNTYPERQPSTRRLALNPYQGAA